MIFFVKTLITYAVKLEKQFLALKPLGALPPKVLMHMYETLIRPIVVYGRDVWGSQSQGILAVD